MSDALQVREQSRIEQAKEFILTQEMRDFIVQKLGLQEEDIRESSKDPSFASDLQNLINNPENQTEKNIFLGKYVFDSIFQEAKRQGKDPVDFAIEQGKNEDFAIQFDAYIQKADKGKTEKQNEGKKQEKISIEKELIKLNNDLKPYNEIINKSLNTDGQKQIAQGAEELKNSESFIKELEGKGYTKEQIQSDDFKDTRSAYYIARNNKELVPFVTSKGNFESASNNIADLLKLDRPLPHPLEQIPKIISPGDRQTQILNTSTALLDSGKYTPELTTYNSSTGKITFRSKYSNDITQIDTSKVPPVLEYSRGGLKIGREIAPVTPENTEYRLNKEQSAKNNKIIKAGEQEYTEIKSDLLSQQSVNYFREQNKDDTSIANLFDQKSALEKEYTEAIDPSAKSEILAKLISSNSDINTKRIQSIKIPSMGSDLMRDTFEGVLEKEGLTLKTLKKQVDIQVELDKKLSKGDNKKPEGDVDQVFEKKSKSTLGYLNYIGYDELGQDILERVVAAVNMKNRGIMTEIDLSKDPKLDDRQEKELLMALARISRKSDTMMNWKEVDGNDPNIAVRQMNSPNWRLSLQAIGKTGEFQDMKGVDKNSFMRYLYRESSNTPSQSK